MNLGSRGDSERDLRTLKKKKKKKGGGIRRKPIGIRVIIQKTLTNLGWFFLGVERGAWNRVLGGKEEEVLRKVRVASEMYLGGSKRRLGGKVWRRVRLERGQRREKRSIGGVVKNMDITC